jgi:hypothetical protein
MAGGDFPNNQDIDPSEADRSTAPNNGISALSLAAFINE